jgi:hypothetical protein
MWLQDLNQMGETFVIPEAKIQEEQHANSRELTVEK